MIHPAIVLSVSLVLECFCRLQTYVGVPRSVLARFSGLYLPRLDWQFSAAARSTADKEPWLLSLTHRLLHGNPDVLHLIDSSNLPYSTPPKYIRGALYKYKFHTAVPMSVQMRLSQFSEAHLVQFAGLSAALGG